MKVIQKVECLSPGGFVGTAAGVGDEFKICFHAWCEVAGVVVFGKIRASVAWLEERARGASASVAQLDKIINLCFDRWVSQICVRHGGGQGVVIWQLQLSVVRIFLCSGCT